MKSVTQSPRRSTGLPDALRDRKDRRYGQEVCWQNPHVAWTEIGDFITDYIVKQTGCAVLDRDGASQLKVFTVTPNPPFLPRKARFYHCHPTNITRRDHVWYALILYGTPCTKPIEQEITIEIIKQKKPAGDTR
jgi:hypothetical protein